MEIRLPLFVRVILLLLGFVLLLYILILWKSVFVPLVFAFVFSLLLMPMCKGLERNRIPRPFAILLCLLVVMLVLTCIVWFLSSQALEFRSELRGLTEKVAQMVESVQQWLFRRFGIEPSSKDQIIQGSLEKFSESGTSFLGSTLNFTADMLSLITLIPIYIFCFLYYRDHFRKFLSMWTNSAQRTEVVEMFDDMQKVVQGYISGLVIVIVVVAMLNSAGLMILGVPFALFFGAFASVLTIIPYIGILLGSLLPALYVLINTGSWPTALGVIGVFVFVQFLEGNFITPNIVGSRVSLNAFSAIVGLVIGGQVWGAAGMILAIPVTAILKVVFDHYGPLQPIGYLLADMSDSAEEGMFSGAFRKIRGLFGPGQKNDPPESHAE